MPIRRRDYQGVQDLEALLRFTQRIWTMDSRFHLGDLAWSFGPEPQADPGHPMALWEQDGQAVAWSWVSLPDRVSLLVDPAVPELADAVLDWAEAIATSPPRVTVVDTERHLVSTLESRGYTADFTGPFFQAHHRDLTDLPGVPAMPAGFTLRPVRGEEDLPRRTEVHQNVWHPSAMTEEHFRTLATTWPYREDFDWVVQAPDGRFVAYCLGWYDEVNRVGEFEPVGTIEEFRRQGLSRAVGLAVLHAFQAAGGTMALVYPRGDDDYPIPKQVYAAMGFKPHARTVTYRPIARHVVQKAPI